MLKKFSFLIIFVLGLASWVSATPNFQVDPLDRMPILEKLPLEVEVEAPVPQRDLEYRKFLSTSVKISVNGSGSGTIIYYDPQKNLAYVASCGHLWAKGTMSAEEGKQKNITCKITVWYHNEKKLETPRSYTAKLVFYSHLSGQDTSLLTFSPDWQPDYFPIASINYIYRIGTKVHSLGCDNGSEVAHYDVNIAGLSGDVITTKNSPRPGRSGGGLIDNDGNYIGTCRATQFTDGSGYGYFTSLAPIHQYWGQQAEYKFLLNLSSGKLVRQIPVKDRTTQQGIYPAEYILIPEKVKL